MNVENTITLLRFLNDKKSIIILRKTVSLLFCGIITSFLFEAFYFKYELLDITAYKSIFRYLVNGQFMPPLLIFLFVWSATKFIFVFYNGHRRSKFHNSVLKKTSARLNIERWLSDKLAVTRAFQRFHFYLKDNPRKTITLKRELLKSQENLEEWMVLCIRMFLVTIVSFATTEYFGWILFIISLIFIIIGFIIMLILDAILEILPSLFDKFTRELHEVFNSEV